MPSRTQVHDRESDSEIGLVDGRKKGAAFRQSRGAKPEGCSREERRKDGFMTINERCTEDFCGFEWDAMNSSEVGQRIIKSAGEIADLISSNTTTKALVGKRRCGRLPNTRDICAMFCSTFEID